MADTQKLIELASQVRRDVLRMVHAVKSGHPGGSLGCADFLTALYFSVLNHDPKFNMNGKNEDVFFLSNGHISPLFYSVLARSGYFPVEELKTFKKTKNYTGHELFSLIIPPAININIGDVVIKDSILESGYLTKDLLGEKKNFAIHQIIWDSYGSGETKKFIDNAQRLIHNFNLYNGFTVG
jgi:transketolase